MPVQPFASVTLTVIGKRPVCVGVPESTPAGGKRQAGRQRAAVQCEGDRADAAALREGLAEGDVDRAGGDMAGLVTVMGWQAMVRLYVGPTAVQPPTSVTLTVIGKVPLCRRRAGENACGGERQARRAALPS